MELRPFLFVAGCRCAPPKRRHGALSRPWRQSALTSRPRAAACPSLFCWLLRTTKKKLAAHWCTNASDMSVSRIRSRQAPCSILFKLEPSNSQETYFAIIRRHVRQKWHSNVSGCSLQTCNISNILCERCPHYKIILWLFIHWLFQEYCENICSKFADHVAKDP